MPRPSPRHAQAPDLVAFGAAVREARLALGMSQEALAYEAGIDRSYMSSVERGGQNVGLVLAAQIARALKLNLADLISAAGL
ncbi:transcriptional regulator [Paucibacter sp. KBW04]|uniref:helix-turn-helix transcriptional regulator n=1 Tax=Paucibacter sp. KBW04 TaxID=2153361 RepID=UPI000F574377|nr:helix-turn-helix transcriptional regulator [Paucibacter sp. KBW04]RQO61312.1 transcriptional regulator [Paucibacter sp. KBW04]